MVTAASRLWPGWQSGAKRQEGLAQVGWGRAGWASPGSLCPGPSPQLYLEQVPHGLREAHSVHGHTHSVGKSENEADGAP